MPICPKCNATIHAGAEGQCPACGYSLKRADAVFGASRVEFTRVLDAAGSLTHRDRMELMHALEELERKLPPIALCIFITDHGDARQFRPHAHWILNHAHIHHPSFGKREKSRAIEDAELTERRPGETRPAADDDEKSPWRLVQWGQNVRSYIRNAFYPLPPPVRQEWMLMLSLDVQLEIACFSWGYMLDPYINPDKITGCIISARLQFRERAMVAALKRVMTHAVRQIAASSRRVNKNMRRSGLSARRISLPLLALTLGLGMLAAAPTAPAAPARPAKSRASAPAHNQTSRNRTKPAAPARAAAKPAAAKPAAPLSLASDDEAEEVEPDADTPAPRPAPQQTPAPETAAEAAGAAAAYDTPPSWTHEDYNLLMEGKLAGCYNLLAAPLAAPPARRSRANAAERDDKVPGRYCSLYTRPEQATDLLDPQLLLSDIERDDLGHVLREANANSPFHIYVALFKAGQEIPSELAVSTLVTAASQPCEYAALIRYSIGESPDIDIGYKEIEPTEDQRRAWLLHAQDAARKAGGGVEGLAAAIRQARADIAPIASGFRPLSPESVSKIRLIPLPDRDAGKAKEPSSKEKFKAALQSLSGNPLLYLLAALAVPAVLAGMLCLRIRRSGRLLDSEPDYRLDSPYGAGVSRYIRYMHGQEAGKEKKIF